LGPGEQYAFHFGQVENDNASADIDQVHSFFRAKFDRESASISGHPIPRETAGAVT